ncbi:MAG: M14 family metallopeptidase, partial [Clostridiales bacterium]|nr:M14 family metallopeptidase [Clostridiales bacterium]
SARDSIKRLKFETGEIKDLHVKLEFSDRKSREKALAALERLKHQHRRGERTDILTYPGCGQITFILPDAGTERTILLPRVSYPKRMLTPGYKTPKKRNIPERDFDLLTLFSAQGLYSDSDKDGLLDGLDTTVVIPDGLNSLGLAPLASRLVLPTAGASFPILYFEREIDDIKALPAPLLIGESAFCRELVRTGKLRLPSLEKGQALVQVVPKAFSKSNALAFLAADSEGLEKALEYFSLTFPYFADYSQASPQLADVLKDVEKFLRGEKGSAEAFIRRNLQSLVDGIKEKQLEYAQAEVYLPEQNPKFESNLRELLEKSLKTEKLDLRAYGLKENKVIFEKEHEFPWEVDKALALLEDKMGSLTISGPVAVSLGVSESPRVRDAVRRRIEEKLRLAGVRDFEVEVLSAYKQGFFWLAEKILPRLRGSPAAGLNIRFAEEKDDFSQPKRFYTEPLRWLQELYPVDEILAAGLGIPLERVTFEMKSDPQPVYEVIALDKDGSVLFRETFSPRTREIPYLGILPEWGTVKVTTGWLEIKLDEHTAFAELIRSDLEKFWDYYQQEILAPVYSYIMKKTGNEPSTSKQPYFKRLLVELWSSEPDYRLGLDEEIISSLEAMHDEIYFDTLDFMRGITEIEVEDPDLPEDTSRLSAPGNIFPLIHPSTEGGQSKVRVVFEDWQAASPQLIVKWKEKGRQEEHSKKMTFPVLKAKTTRFPRFIYNGKEDRIENLRVEMEFDKEADYLTLLDIIQTASELRERGVLLPSFSYPRLKSLTLAVQHKDLEKEEVFPVAFEEKEKNRFIPEEHGEVRVRTDEIISPETCVNFVRRLGRMPTVHAYIGGFSYENRKVPVLELFTPQSKYVSLPRLITVKPTLFLSGRQHANEVSATTYILKFAELLASDDAYQDFVKKMNFVLEPMENPDGAALAFELQKLTPFHSLHAGRYSALGVDIGTQVGLARPLLPEAAVRKNLNERWLPDIHLNLHGYPSHEWVQAFSNYSPYLFRDYWIPRGWFAYYRAPRLPLYDKYKEAGDDLRRFIIAEMGKDEKIRESNKKFYSRYDRWATRWQPHLNELELHDGVNLYAARRSSQENKLSERTRITYVEQTPELMDETAQGAWLDFLCQQGLTYLRAHVKYLSQAAFEVGRIDEEIQDRVRFQFSRSRPGRLKTSE